LYASEQGEHITVVAGLFGHGTVYFSDWLGSQGYIAGHEWLYNSTGIIPPPVPGQTHEVSGYAFPHKPDMLLVRDPRAALRSLKRHNPHYHMYTHKHFGYHPHTTALLCRSWVDWYTLGLETASSVLRIEDIPEVEGLRRNAQQHGKQRPHTWEELTPEVIDLAVEFGYVVG